jgi:hypothetical protein
MMRSPSEKRVVAANPATEKQPGSTPKVEIHFETAGKKFED